jgi:radical SAM protein with 4Fe4S-binding SPASM domain
MRVHPLRLVRAGAAVLRAHTGRLPRPLKINLCLTYWCQYRCKTCNIWLRKPTDELTTDELLTFVARNTETSWLDVTGGEIFLRPDVGDILLAIVRQWKRLALLHFPTNGFLTDKIVSVAERLASERAVPVVVTVSLDGDEKRNDEIRGIRGGYRRQVATFNALRKIHGVRPVFGLTLSRHNAGHVQEAFDACRADCPGLTITDFHVNVAQRSAHYYGTDDANDYTPAIEDVRRELAWYARERGVPRTPSALVESRYLRLLETFVATGRTPMPCHALRSSCFIDPWGTVYPCITYAKPLGKLRETGMDLGPIWSSQAVAQVQAEIWQGSCPQCWTACEAYQSVLGNALAPWRTTSDERTIAQPAPAGRG